MATWSDIERNLSRIEELDQATLEEFAKVAPPLSYNPNFDRRFDHAEKRIRHRLDQLNSQRGPQGASDAERWYRKPFGIIALSVTAALVAAVIKYLFDL